MTQRKLIIGVDGGGTKTQAILFDNTGKTIDELECKGSNLYVYGEHGIKRIIGLIKDPRSLMQVRQTRLKMMGENNQTSYDDISHIKFEISQARLIFTKYAWPSIDVSRRSVEETSASVIKIYNTKGTSF